MKLLYFAWLRERIGVAGEDMVLPADVSDVNDLIEHLAGRGPGYASAFAERSAIKVAINQDFAKDTDPVEDADEVAFFPPVTGGR